MVTFFISISTLSWIISCIGGVPGHVGTASTAFLKSPMGVYQALHLAKDEMNIIKQDSWDEAVWGSSEPRSAHQYQTVPLRFYFGEQVSRSRFYVAY